MSIRNIRKSEATNPCRVFERLASGSRTQTTFKPIGSAPGGFLSEAQRGNHPVIGFDARSPRSSAVAGDVAVGARQEDEWLQFTEIRLLARHRP